MSQLGEEADAWWTLPGFAVEARESIVKGRELKRKHETSWFKHLNPAKLPSSLREVNLNQIPPNWLLILFCFPCFHLQSTLPVLFLLTYDAVQC